MYKGVRAIRKVKDVILAKQIIVNTNAMIEGFAQMAAQAVTPSDKVALAA